MDEPSLINKLMEAPTPLSHAYMPASRLAILLPGWIIRHNASVTASFTAALLG
jgi:hypothetical protein